MGNFREKKNRGFGKRERSERPAMHKAICADCGRSCEVPFRPIGDKPVYCSDCFGRKEDSGGNRFERRDSRPSFGGEKKMFTAICDKCGRSCEVPFRPTGDKPVYCSDCFSKSDKGASHAPSGDQYKKQFEMLNTKLDNIMRMLFTKEEKPVVKAAPKAVEKKVVASKPVEKKIAAKKPAAKKAVVAKKVAAPKKAVAKKVAKKAVAKKKK